MKKQIILLLFSLLTTGFYGQTIALGVKGGVNISNTWLKIEPDIANPGDTKGRAGVHIGVLADVGFNPFIHVQLETQYSREGDDIAYFDYINIPVLLKIYAIKDLLYIQSGPQIGFLTKVEGGDEGFNNTNFVINFGIGIASKLGLTLDVRYGLGITSFIDERIRVDAGPDIIFAGEINAYTQVLQVGLGYKFDL